MPFRLTQVLLIPMVLTIVNIMSAQVPPAYGEMSGRPALYYPAPPGGETLQFALGLRLLTLPQDIVEEEINKAPSLDLSGRLAVFPWLNVTGAATVQYLSNELRVGLHAPIRIGDVALGAGYDVGLWFGFVDLEGFDNRANGWTHYPHLSVGHDFGDVFLTIRAELIWMQALRSFAGDNEVRSTKNRIAGSAWSAVLEQPFWGNTHVQLGLRLSYSDFHYQSWFAFSTYERKLLFSELLFGVLL